MTQALWPFIWSMLITVSLIIGFALTVWGCHFFDKARAEPMVEVHPQDFQSPLSGSPPPYNTLNNNPFNNGVSMGQEQKTHPQTL